MDFRLDPAQIELQETVARFCDDHFPLDAVVAREGVPVDRATWRELADLGLLGLLVAQDQGGSGLRAVDGALVFEQVGAHLVPGPVLWSVLAASLVDGATTGECLVGGIGADTVHDGSAVVEHAADIEVLLVLEDDRVVAHLMAELADPDPLVPLDPLTPVGRVTGLGDGRVVGDRATAERLRLLGTVLSAAALSGIAAQALETARTYALERQQFDVPIGSFQAVKHLLADRYVATVLAQSSTYAAAAVLDDPGADDPARAASAAKLLAADAAIDGAATAVQVLGGMGFTWDMLPNHLLKRAWVYEQSFGVADDHARDLGTALVEAGA